MSVNKPIYISIDDAKSMIESGVPSLRTIAINTYPELDENRELTWEEFGPVEGYYINTSSSIHMLCPSGQTTIDKSTWPTKELAEAALALSQLLQWRDKVNDGWVPDWWQEKCSEYKYCIEIGATSIDAVDCFYSVHLLAFPKAEIRDKFLKQHKTLLEIAKPLL